MLLCRTKWVSLGLASALFFVSQAAAAAFTDIPASELPGYLHAHTRVVVLFNSPDPQCQFCGVKADQPFALVSDRFSGQVSFARVEWAPWSKFPPQVRALNIRAVPAEVAFVNGSIVAIYGGAIRDVDGYTKGLKERFHETGTMAK